MFLKSLEGLFKIGIKIKKYELIKCKRYQKKVISEKGAQEFGRKNNRKSQK